MIQTLTPSVLRSTHSCTKLGSWVKKQRLQYRLYREGQPSPMTTLRIQELESLGFEWVVCVTAWEDRLSELADYCKIHGHCKVPKNYSENAKLAYWVGTQKTQYRFHREGKRSSLTLSRIQELEGLGFEWRSHCATWEERLSELANYRKMHGHCNVPQNYSENSKLGMWVANQRRYYRLQLEGKKSNMTLPRIQELESLGFEWKSSVSRRKGKPEKPSLDEDATLVCKGPVEAPEHTMFGC